MKRKDTDLSIKCNNCGGEPIIEKGILKEDMFGGHKEWGYFSNKDLEVDSFYLCEECYDEITGKFKIPVKRSKKTEIL